MSTITEPTFHPVEAFGLITKYRRLILTGTTLMTALFIAAAYTLPKKYKSHFTLTINTLYFQNPLIRDFIPEVSDYSEMRSQRESLIRQALTPEFLGTLGVKYRIYSARKTLTPGLISHLKSLGIRFGFYQASKEGSGVAAAREDLLSHIQILNLDNTTFSVSFMYSDPDVALRATQDIYAQVIQTLLVAHTNNLVNVRDAIRKRLESLSFSLVSSSPDPRASIRPQVVSDELADIRNQIRALSIQYTEDHPVIKALRDRERILARWQGTSSIRPAGQVNDVSGEQVLPVIKDIYGDLMKKMNYLNIALEADHAHQGDYFATIDTPSYPESPLWPKKWLLALWGCALGFGGSLSIAAMLEYFHRTALHASSLAEQLGIPLLGVVPNVPWNLPLKSESRN